MSLFQRLLYIAILRNYQGLCDPEAVPSKASFQDPRGTVPEEIRSFLMKLANDKRNRGTDIDRSSTKKKALSESLKKREERNRRKKNKKISRRGNIVWILIRRKLSRS